MADFRKYGINPAKARKYESITYIVALINNILMKNISTYLANFNLTPAKFNVLMVIRYQSEKDGINQVIIGKHLIVSAGNITSLIEKLLKDDLITRQQNPLSRRENIIKITTKGVALTNKVWKGYDKLVKEMTNTLPSKYHDKLSEILENWFLNISENYK